ncbi:hypothetical protein GO491_11385 [Flavobacteriaceae bacterium Ap0902]|nr:hypothetical protein [Flavobacteriaceae bacterium Ap0902]
MSNGQKASNKVKDIEIVKIHTYTRGVSNTLTVNPNAFSKFKFEDKMFTKSIETNQWEKIKELVSGLDIKELDNLKVTSKQHQTDGAMAEVLTITINGDNYQSPTYDAGEPPTEIKELVSYIKRLDNTK